jgi:hypothetical protein
MTMNRCSGHLVISFGRLLHMPQAIQLTKSQSKWSAPTNNYAARLCTHEAHQAKQTPLPTELRPVLASYGQDGRLDDSKAANCMRESKGVSQQRAKAARLGCRGKRGETRVVERKERRGAGTFRKCRAPTFKRIFVPCRRSHSRSHQDRAPWWPHLHGDVPPLICRPDLGIDDLFPAAR